MIQRIQTLYLLLASIISGLLLAIPYCFLSVTKPLFYTFISITEKGNYTVVLIALTVLSSLVSFATIFLYKNRLLQIRLCWLTIVLSIAITPLLVLSYFSIDLTPYQGIGIDTDPWIGMFLPTTSLVFTLLALRAIKKDEALVRSADRIR